jgi:hypothetical protein
MALQGAASFVVQTTLAAFVRARLAEGVRVAGVVEEFSGQAGAGCAGRTLSDIATGRRHRIGQDLGPGSLACHLDASGVADACCDALAGIAAGCDLVVLAKFGKLEAERNGLLQAFAAAIEQDLPIVTSVAPSFTGAWNLYASPLARFVEPRTEAVEAWWRALQSDRTGSAAPRRAIA